MNLETYLYSKPLYYDEIDYAYFPDLWSRIKHHFDIRAKIIHVIGTNGKGSSSKTISYYLYRCHHSVGSYNSPELFRYDDMYILNNQEVEESLFVSAHTFLQKIIPPEDKEKISRFEYTTLLAIQMFQHCDYMVLEAGLGGEYDATSVLKKDLSVVTTIGIDHVAFLGDTLELIVKTKLNSIQNTMVLGKQVYANVYEIARVLLAKQHIRCNRFSDLLSPQEQKAIDTFCKKSGYPEFLADNISLAMAAIKLLGLKIETKLLENLSFRARFEQIRENIIIDVGHNSLAASAIVEYIPEGTTLIYNSYRDKNYVDVIRIFLKRIKCVVLIPIKEETRVCPVHELYLALKTLPVDVTIMGDDYRLQRSQNYFVFGSFSVVKAFYKRFLEEK